jgi:hypothetical protein
MKIKTIVYYLILIVISLILFTIDFKFTLFKSEILRNGFIVLIINTILSIVLFFLYAFLNKGFTVSRKAFVGFLWIIFVLVIYFLIGYFVADNLFLKNSSQINNLLPFSILSVLGIVLWIILYFSIGSYNTGWISLKGIGWVIFMAFFSYALPFERCIDSKKNKIYFILIPLLPAIIMWLGFEFKG